MLSCRSFKQWRVWSCENQIVVLLPSTLCLFLALNLLFTPSFFPSLSPANLSTLSHSLLTLFLFHIAPPPNPPFPRACLSNLPLVHLSHSAHIFYRICTTNPALMTGCCLELDSTCLSTCGIFPLIIREHFPSLLNA